MTRRFIRQRINGRIQSRDLPPLKYMTDIPTEVVAVVEFILDLTGLAIWSTMRGIRAYIIFQVRVYKC